ncbi:MAG: molybdopterin-binding protein [Clostridia bacterium]|nr:molybdopterin-binding protein [Clostridia bacterium]
MKKIDVESAVGMELCHDITAMRDGFKGAAFKRGHIIAPGDIPLLLDLGKRSIYVWEENAGEIHEEDAAVRLKAMSYAGGCHATDVSEGKTMLVADRRGMLRVDTALLKAVNSIEDITISTLPDHYPVEAGDKVASMRIVPLVTKLERIEKAERLCDGKRLIEILPYRERKIGVIITGSEIYNNRIKDKFEPVVREKMKKYPAQISSVAICDDDLDMICSAARRHLNDGCDFLIFTGGMSVDPDDLTPGAIRRLGADIVSYGVPSQPGNMTLVAYLGGVSILGVPGAAISLPTTMFDVLLPQIFTGLPITGEDIVRLGDGGLCQRCETCHFPNCTFGRY